MRVFVTGATGALGRCLLPRLVAAGHDIVAMTRSPEKAAELAAAGIGAAVADGLDRSAVMAAVERVRPDVLVHQMTALAGLRSFRRFDAEFAQTNRLRTEGTAILLAAARAAGVGRMVAQSYAGWPYARRGGPVKSEADDLDPHPPRHMRRTLAAIRQLEAMVSGSRDLEGLVLRYGGFYGPGTSLSLHGEFAEAVRRRRFPVVGSGAGVWSFIHIDDAASATVAAVERGAPGIYNIVDDDPAPVRIWLPALAEALGAGPPRRVPAWLGHLVLGGAGTSLMTQVRGASNEKARRELAWEPAVRSWREGFRTGLGDAPAPTQARAAAGRPERGPTPVRGAPASPG